MTFMTTLKDRLRTDLTAAMKARDNVRAGTLRMLLAAINNAEVAGSEARQLSDDEVVTVLAGEAKRRREAMTAYADGGRPDQAAKEQSEADIITEYLPEQLSEEEIRDLVATTLDETGAREQGMKSMGTVMGALKPKVQGRADGAVVAAEVKRQLSAG